jgi:hypothetical protein
MELKEIECKYDNYNGTVVVYQNECWVSSISLAGDGSNCKLSYIHRAGNLTRFNDEEKKQVLDFALRYLKGCIIINTVKKDVAEFIKNTYPHLLLLGSPNRL